MSAALEPRFLEVWLHGRHLGWLCETSGTVRFTPHESFLADPLRPTLSLSMTIPGNDALTREVLSRPFDPAMVGVNGKLPPFFAGLLPEGKLRERLAATRKNLRDTDDFGVLAAAGEDLPGAVTVLPAQLEHLTQAARAFGITGGADNVEMSVPEAAAEGAASVSGVQNKLALSYAHEGKRFTLPMRGKLSGVIGKLPEPNDDAQIFNEYVSMQLAAKAGVQVAVCRPRPVTEILHMPELAVALGAGSHFLAVDRFDRTPGNTAVHIEDACQALTLMPSRKYGSKDLFVRFLRAVDVLSVRSAEDVRQFFIRQTVNALIGNADAHLKNFSLIYQDGMHPALSPAYDIVCVAALPAFTGFRTNVAIDAMQRQETIATYRDIARQAGVSEKIAVAAVKSAVEQAQEHWPRMLQELPAPARVRDEVLERLRTLPLARLQKA